MTIYIIDSKDRLLFFPERQLRLIEEWKREDIVFYDRARAFEAASNMVNSNAYITLIGGPASGKSATARHIALKFESDSFEVVPYVNRKIFYCMEISTENKCLY